MSEYFKISFGSLNAEKLRYVAYSNNEHDMNMFIKQHCLTPNNVTIVNVDSENDVAFNIIKEFKFKSNQNNQLFTIYTTDSLVNQAATIVAEKLSDATLFGPPIERQDIELMRMIDELVHDLDYVFILDFNLMNDDDEYIYSDWEKHVKCLGNPTDYVYGGEQFDSYIFDRLLDDVSNTESIMPITLEAYVNNFVDILTDKI